MSSEGEGGQIQSADRAMREAYIVIAAFNEGQVIGEVVQGLRAVYPNVVVVDDGSADDTQEQALAAGATVLRHLINRGQGAALQTGIRYSLREGAPFVVTFDADGQHKVADIARLLEPIRLGEVDICLGSRFLTGRKSIPPARRLLLRAAVVFTRVTSRMKLSDTHNGLRAFSREAAQALDISLDRMAHASEILDQIRASGYRYREIPVEIAYTQYSLAKGQRSTQAVRVAVDYLIGKLLQ